MDNERKAAESVLRGSQEPLRLTPREFRERVGTLAWNMDYGEFCRRLDLRDDSYAENLFSIWGALGRRFDEFGSYFDRLMEGMD